MLVACVTRVTILLRITYILLCDFLLQWLPLAGRAPCCWK